ncbi:MAG: phosphatase PAP2 family protein [Ruminococcus sp.]|nr:phosphatase PAP2 family protein [Ruminococcus sp.]
MADFITQIDFSILDFIQNNLRCDILDKIMVFLSLIGEGGIVWFMIAVPMLFFKKSRICGVVMILSMGITLLLGEFLLKNLIGRVRPCNINTEIEMLVKRPRSFSFPSGHTSSSFASATTIFKWNKKYGVFALILAALIGFSRLYNYVHFPTDVLAGALFGILMSLLVYHLFIRYKLDNKLGNLRFSKRG